MSERHEGWKRFAFRAATLAAVMAAAFVGNRLANARDGVPGGAARSFVTVAGTLTGVTGTATARFRFYSTMTGGMPLCESSAMVTGGTFSAEVPLEGTGATGPRCATLFDGADVYVEVAVNGTTLGERRPINPVPYAHYASQYGTPDCPPGYERIADAFFTGDKRLCVKRRADRTTYDEVVRVGTGPSAFWIDRYEASVWSDAQAAMNSRRGDAPADYGAAPCRRTLAPARVGPRQVPPGTNPVGVQAGENRRGAEGAEGAEEGGRGAGNRSSLL